MKNRDKFDAFMTIISSQIDKALDQVFIEIVWKTVSPFDDDSCIKAFNHITPRIKFQSDITTMLLEQLEAPELLAWVEVEKAIRSIGPYQSVRFPDPVIHGVIDSLGGWPAFQDFKSSELTWKQKEFLERYKAMAGKDEFPDYLPGLIEIENQAPEKIKEIGNNRVKKLKEG
ncbi:MAG: DUF6475 domain-containing protein [Thermodesulfobacteriota bacterium]|nr:DUF6475 domain-containing protein [Thermodesulfobacteriota bacterium]